MTNRTSTAKPSRSSKTTGPRKSTLQARKSRATSSGEGSHRAVSARERLVSTVDEVHAIEQGLGEMVDKTRARLALGAQDGAISAGGFSSADSLLVRVARPGTFLGALGHCALPAVDRPSAQFGKYAELLGDLESHERDGMALIRRARERLSCIEEGEGFLAGGYGSYEEFLERVLGRLPFLGTILLATDTRPTQPSATGPELLSLRYVPEAPSEPRREASSTLLPSAPGEAPLSTDIPPQSTPAPPSRAILKPQRLRLLAALGVLAILGTIAGGIGWRRVRHQSPAGGAPPTPLDSTKLATRRG